MNWLDIIIILGLIFAAYLGYKNGFVFGLIELLGIFVSIFIPLLIWGPMGIFFHSMGVSKLYSGLVGFIISLAAIMIIYFIIMNALYKKVQEKLLKLKINSYFGIFPGLIQGTIVIAMIITLVAVTPASPIDQRTISSSYFPKMMLDKTMSMAENVNSMFGSAIHEAMGFITIKPSSDETIKLGFKAENVNINEDFENQMLQLVNKERTDRGLHPLMLDKTIRNVARNYSVYMLQNGFFSHTGLDGSNPSNRMLYGGVIFIMSGENLAFAPSVKMAHAGLMNSPRHKANILNPEYERIGIGVASSGKFRVMFTQNFAK